MNQHREHQREDERAREDEPLVLRRLRTRERLRILPHRFIEYLLHEETPSQFNDALSIAHLFVLL